MVWWRMRESLSHVSKYNDSWAIKKLLKSPCFLRSWWFNIFILCDISLWYQSYCLRFLLHLVGSFLKKRSRSTWISNEQKINATLDQKTPCSPELLFLLKLKMSLDINLIFSKKNVQRRHFRKAFIKRSSGTLFC